jgi:PKD repeat protein
VLISFLLVILPTVAGATLVTTTETAPTSTNYYLGYGSSYKQQAQTVKAAGTEIEQISVALIKVGTPTQNVQLYVRSTIGGTNLGSATITPAMVTSTDYQNPSWATVPISVTGLTTGNTYYVVLYTPTTLLQDYYKTPANVNNPYPDGAHYRGNTGAENSPYDLLVKVWFKDFNPPVAGFTATPTSGSAPLSVQFTDTSTNSPTSRTWGFGDGTNSTSQNPTHSYAPGTYTVTLTATNGVGSDDETKAAYITVVKATPVITWANPAAITYGTALSGTQLNANANVAGSYVYTPAAGAVLSAGSQTLHADFTPADTANYNTASKDVTITVTPPPSGAAFSATPTSGVAPLLVTFTDQSTNSPTS